MKDEKRVFLNVQHIILSIFSILAFITMLFMLFNNLGENAIADWDEARHGINAYEMLKSNNWIISTYKYEPDLWNLKPPFSYYLIALSYQLFGFSTVSLRLYSVVSIILIFIISLLILYKYSEKASVIIFSITFLSFSDFFVGHCGRTGDADALFLLLYLISMSALVICKNHHWSLYVFGFGFSLAFLTKSFHAAPIMLIGITYIVLSKIYKELKIKDYIITFLTSSLPIIIWGIFRYIADGMSFLGIMFGVDVVNRMESGVSSGGSYTGFIKLLITYRPTQVIIATIILCYIIQSIIKRTIKTEISRFQLLLIVWFVISLIFFSLTRTVEFWYYIPTFFSLVLLVSTTISDTILMLKEKGIKSYMLVSVVSFGFISLFVVFGMLGIYRNLKLTNDIKETNAQNAIVSFVKQNPSFKGYNCYFVKSESEDYCSPDIKEGYWEQSDVLCAELYGDYKCLDGGVDEFIQDDKSIIFIEKTLFDKYKDQLNQYNEYKFDDSYYNVLVNNR